MTTNTPQSLWKNARNIHHEYADDSRVLGVVGLVLVGLVIFSGDRLSYSMNAYTELLSIIVTVVVVDRLATRRAEQQRKAELIAQMASKNNAVAVGAATLMKHLGWGFCEDDSLNHIDLVGANLEQTSFVDVNLKGAYLSWAYLSQTSFERANLENADFIHAILKKASFGNANLEGTQFAHSNLEGTSFINASLERANLSGANLKEAKLMMANLKEANLSNTNLEGANLSSAKLNEQTILPDDLYWTPETDMRKYTDPNHPEFWHPEWAKHG